MDNFSVSRRTVAKGMAWAVPSIAVGSSVNSTTSSAEDAPMIYDCAEFSSNGGFYLQSADVITWTPSVGATSIKTRRGRGTAFDVRLGTFQFHKPLVRDAQGQVVDPKIITGYRVDWKEATHPSSIIIQGAKPAKADEAGLAGVKRKWIQGPKDHYGSNRWDGYFSIAPNSGPLVIGAGLVYTGYIQSTRPFSGFAWDPEALCGKPGQPYMYLLVSIPIRISFLKGLRGVGNTSTESNACRYYVNYMMQAGGGACGTYRAVRDGRLGANMAGTHEVWITSDVPQLPPPGV